VSELRDAVTLTPTNDHSSAFYKGKFSYEAARVIDRKLKNKSIFQTFRRLIFGPSRTEKFVRSLME
jgi:hypothetical protein